MKILFNIGNLQKGGAERVIANLSNNLNNKGYDISIVIGPNEQSFYKINQDVKIYAIDKNKVYKNRIQKNILRIKELNKVIKEVKPDVIVSFLPEPSYRVLFIKVFNRKLKIIVSVRNDPKIEYKSILNKIAMKILYPKANGFVFQTAEARDFFCNKIKRKSVIIPNPLNEQFVDEKINKNKNKNKLIVNVGRLEEQKNQALLIKAFNEVVKKHPEYKLIIYGEGTLRRKLEDMISDMGLNKNVFLPGNVNDVIDKLNEAEIFILSSNFEGMPNALMEAMAMGLACISTDCPCGGPRFLIKQDSNGILLKKDCDYKDMAEKINYLIENEQIRKQISNKAIEIRDELNPEKINEIWEKYIRRIGEKNNGN